MTDVLWGYSIYSYLSTYFFFITNIVGFYFVSLQKIIQFVMHMHVQNVKLESFSQSIAFCNCLYNYI